MPIEKGSEFLPAEIVVEIVKETEHGHLALSARHEEVEELRLGPITRSSHAYLPICKFYGETALAGTGADGGTASAKVYANLVCIALRLDLWRRSKQQQAAITYFHLIGLCICDVSTTDYRLGISV